MRQVMRMVIDPLVFVLYLHSDIKLEVNDLQAEVMVNKKVVQFDIPVILLMTRLLHYTY